MPPPIGVYIFISTLYVIVFLCASTLVVAQHFWRLPNAIRAYWGGCALILFLKIGFYIKHLQKNVVFGALCASFLYLCRVEICLI